MSSEKTTNLQLHKWAASDFVKRTEFNDNFMKIDKAIYDKADKTEINNLATGKADKDYVDTELESVTASLAENTRHKLDWVNVVEMFNADPTGAISSSQAFQDAVDYLNTGIGGTIYIPNGKYLIDVPIDIYQKKNYDIELNQTEDRNPSSYFDIAPIIRFVGASRESVVLHIDAEYGFTGSRDIATETLALQKIKFEDIHFHGNATNFQGNGTNTIINLRNTVFYVKEFTMVDCTISGFGVGLDLSRSQIDQGQGQAWGSYIDRCMFYGNNIGFKITSDQIYVTGCQFTRNASWGIVITGRNHNINFTDCLIQSNSPHRLTDFTTGQVLIGEDITADIKTVSFNGCYLEPKYSLYEADKNLYSPMINFGTNATVRAVSLNSCYGNGLGSPYIMHLATGAKVYGLSVNDCDFLNFYNKQTLIYGDSSNLIDNFRFTGGNYRIYDSTGLNETDKDFVFCNFAKNTFNDRFGVYATDDKDTRNGGQPTILSGYINSDGTVRFKTGDFTVAKTATGTYRITLAHPNIVTSGGITADYFPVLVTPSNDPTTGITDSTITYFGTTYFDIKIYRYSYARINASEVGERVDRSFSFMVVINAMY